jgi:hypothetical protein
MRRHRRSLNSFYAPYACGTKPHRRPAATLLGRCVAEQSSCQRLNLHCGKLALAAMARTALHQRYKISAWASWLPHWRTCMRAISRKDSIGFDSRFLVFFVFLPSVQKFEAGRLLFLIGSAVPEGRPAPRTTTQSLDPRNLNLAQQRFMLNTPLGATFVVNSEPHTGARPSVHLCVGLINPQYASIMNTASPSHARQE